MALTAVQSIMSLEEKKAVHPFFSRQPNIHAHESDETAIKLPEDARHDPDYDAKENEGQKGPKKRGRKPGSKNKNKAENGSQRSQPPLEHFTRRLNGGLTEPKLAADGQVRVEQVSLEEDPNEPRSKRRKTGSPEPLKPAVEADLQHQQPEAETQLDSAVNTIISGTKAPQSDMLEALPRPKTPSDVSSNSDPNTLFVDAEPPQPQTEAPKKLLKITKNGKLLSSPPPKAEPESTTSPKKRRVRKASKPKPSPTIVIIKYGHDAASQKRISERIDAILNSMKRARGPAISKKQPPPPPKPVGPPKSTHPFFLAKAAKKLEDTAENDPTKSTITHPRSQTQKTSAVTPGKLRTESLTRRSNVQASAFGLGFGNARTPKATGAGEAPWPSKETLHVRNLDADAQTFSLSTTRTPVLKARKLKTKKIEISQDESMTTALARQLRPAIHVHNNAPASEFEPPQDVRLPVRLLTTGFDIQNRVRSQVRAVLPPSGVLLKGQGSAHPAIQDLFFDIENTLTPFDLGKCETQSWTTKYAPKHAAHVLQSGREATALYEWLSSLTVMTVEGAHSAKLPDAKKPPKKKRRKEVDDFIVDSDDDEEEMVELAGGGQYGPATGPKSIRAQRWARNRNVVLISGPSGCGKSAMVHAVAKDLEFEVFEINSGSRRSGKDIQDKVGDMSENHLVNHKRNEVSTPQERVSADDTDTERQDEAFQNDIASGRQKTMGSFFKMSGPPKAKPEVKTPKPQKAPVSAQATLNGMQASRKSQKQSLILFEEADILFEEDQQFWAYVTKLASQSKRPVVITCNNEALIPSYDLPLAAVLRLSPPPVDLATDYMLVLAGREGHILKRDAVSSLYESKGYDLRASISELDLWCQMSVGDRKGGLEWMFQRWPRGIDVDDQGRLLRVASEDTYLPGMGYLSHNVFETSDSVAFDKQDELLKETWASWGLNPSDWSVGPKPAELTDGSALDTLTRLEALSEYVSAADIYSSIDLPSYENDENRPTDPSLPPLREKEYLNYTISNPVLQVDHVHDFNSFDTDIFVSTHLLIRRAYGDMQVLEGKLDIPTSEAGFTEAILQHQRSTRTKFALSRPDFSRAFDILAYAPDTLPGYTAYSLNASSFDRTFNIIVEDIAPYVRSIVHHERVLEDQRLRLSHLLSESGRIGTKRARTTRAARTAMEGGERRTKRRERWFDGELNKVLVMGTAGSSWGGLGTVVGVESEGSEKTGSGNVSQEDYMDLCGDRE